MFVAILAFSNGFLMLYRDITKLNGDDKKDNAIKSQEYSFLYTYKLVIGDNKMDDYEDAKFAYVLFYMCTLFNSIIMMNLLISIISDTYANIQAQAEQATFA